ncbi:alpha-L-rhamnosidase [Subtercola lobariae]|uniref:alpha-L-rhamnosidase n=1 Tax=Subtercola lobariae TaxID=1588641 RepID=A0A917F096_9MICO|nr:alpha-L-rhamnosidase [Subtercola lobariae]
MADSAWSAPAYVEAALLEPGDWSAQWITPATGGGIFDPAPVLGTRFDVSDGLVDARLRITALGIFEARINGALVSEDHFAPGWSSYDHRLRYQNYDVTALLQPGENDLEALLGNGWYRGRIASFSLHRGHPYGEKLALLAQLELTFADGRRETIGSDGGWSAGGSRVLANDFYDGQTTDLHLPVRPARDGAVTVVPSPGVELVAPVAPAVRETQTVPAVSTTLTASGRLLVDFGQNVVGWVRLRVRGEAGQRVSVRHAEVLENGELSLRPLRSAKVTDTYILAGTGDAGAAWDAAGGVAGVAGAAGAAGVASVAAELGELLEPNLVFHGFRYIDIDGLNAAEDPATELLSVEAVVLGSDLERTGWFETSSVELNQLHQNVVWGMRGNFLDVPTDCPQRDERLGWTGDIQVFAPTATSLFDVSGFLSSWLADLAADQLPDGTVPAVIPRVFLEEKPLAGWGDAAVIVPWALYEAYGDRAILERQYPSMTRWHDRVTADTTDNLWLGGDQLGDWLDPLAPPDAPAKAQADPDVVASAYYARSIDLLARVAAVLGRHDEAERYERLATGIRAAFNREFVSPEGIVRSDCQTVYALAIRWRLITDADVLALAGQRLRELVDERNFTVATGFLGTPVILDALLDAGQLDAAYAMVLGHEHPSWLYSVDLGATTVWERWDSLLPDGSVNPGEMTSFNHYAFGAVADWMHRVIGGLTPTSPGYRDVSIAPRLGGDLTSASISHLSPFGLIAADWCLNGGVFALALTVPVGVTAAVTLPSGEHHRVTHGEHVFTCDVP